MTRFTLRTTALALALAASAVGVNQASAMPLGGPHFPHGGFGHGPFGHHGFGHGPFGPVGFGWGHPGWGRGPGWGWGGRPIVYGGCFVKRFVDDDGDLVVRRVCY